MSNNSSNGKNLRRYALRRLRQLLRPQQNADAIARIEDPEILLHLAKEEMTTRHALNRDRAVQAITQKNNLESMVRKTEEQVANLHEQIGDARNQGDEARASLLMREEERYRQSLYLASTQLEQATLTAEQVKKAIRREEDVIRRKTAEMTALKTQWKLVQIERSLTISLAQLTATGNEPVTLERILERHRYSRELAVEIVTQKNVLALLAQETQQRAEQLRTEANNARRAGDEDAENTLLRELEQQEGIRAATDAALTRANAVTTRVRTLLSEEEARVRALARAHQDGKGGNGTNAAEATHARLSAPDTDNAERKERKERAFWRRNGLLLAALVLTILLLLLALLP